MKLTFLHSNSLKPGKNFSQEILNIEASFATSLIESLRFQGIISYSTFIASFLFVVHFTKTAHVLHLLFQLRFSSTSSAKTDSHDNQVRQNHKNPFLYPDATK